MTSEKKWTPGPWELIDSKVHVVGGDKTTGSVIVCRTGFSAEYGDEPAKTLKRWKADACLVAAAPELYEALEYQKRMQDGGPDCDLQTFLTLRDEALAKARGETHDD